MQRLQAFKFELRPNGQQARQMARFAGSCQTEREVDTPIPEATSAIGIDVGIARFATMSDGSFIAPIHSFKRHEQRLKRYQCCMSRKQKGSKNWHKAKRRVQRIHTRIANARNDFLHKTSTALSKAHAMIVVEDLAVRQMSQSAAGTAAHHSKQVKAKSGLNKAILDQGWGEFRRQLGYKLAWQGGMLIAVPPHHTSQTRPHCAREEISRAKVARPKRAPSVKQEPTEATAIHSNVNDSAVGIPALKA